MPAKGDGLTSALRRAFPVRAYVGIELEVNQKIVFGPARRWSMLRSALVDSLRMALRGSPMSVMKAGASGEGANVHPPLFDANP
jgi:hypothetical protein